MTDNPYASADDIFGCDDLREQDVTAWGWKRNGAAMKIRVRGLPLATVESVKAESKGDYTKLVTGYLREGFVMPRLNQSQAERMVAEKHAGQVEQIAGLIISLSEIDYDAIAAEAKKIADMADDSGESNAAPTE